MNYQMEVTESSYNEAYSFLNSSWQKFFQDRHVKRDIKTYYLVAKEDSIVVGAIDFRTNDLISYIKSFFVDKDLRGKGVGKSLLQTCERISLENGCSSVMLKTSSIHEEAIKFYKSQGYEIVATVPDFHYRVDWFYFRKELVNSLVDK